MASKLPISEQELVSLLKSRSEEGYRLLYKHYAGALFGVVMKIVQEEEVAQDVLQDTFVKIWKNIGGYDRSKGTLFTWMLNVARNTAIDYKRSSYVRHQIRLDGDFVGMKNEPSESKNYDFIGIDKVLNELKPEQKLVLDALYFEGYTHEEASEKLNMPLGTLKTRARTAINQLRALLKERENDS